MQKKRKRWIRFALKKRGNPAQNRRRVGKFLIFVTMVSFLVFLGNFAYIIGTDSKFGKDLSEGAKSVHQKEVTVQAKRGTIYDRTGAPIAEDSTTYTVYAIIDTTYVSAKDEKLYVQPTQFQQVAQTLSTYLGMEVSYVLEQLNQPTLKQVYFGSKGKNISYNTMTTIQSELEAAGVKGISFDTNPGRMYTNGDFASFFIGLAQLEENKDGSQTINGQMGLEKSLNSILAGQDGKVVYEKDYYGRIIPGSETVLTPKQDGQDVYTTLSMDLQNTLETSMTTFFEKSAAASANVTLVSAKTGEILATAQRPSFNPDTKEGLGSDLVWRAQLYQENYEPGSTMKVLSFASAIDNGTFRANDYYTNTGYKIADVTINDWTINAGRDPVTLTFSEGFALSSNVAATILQQEMGDEKWLNYLEKFRFGYPTRFGLAGEEAGQFPDDNIVSIAQSSFGQGISVTQVQMLRAFSAIANDGVMLEPKFISGLYDSENQTARLSQAEVVGHPVSAAAAQQTRELMIGVGTNPYYGTLYSKYVGDGGGAVVSVDGYNVSVKSGTSQIAKEDGSGYKEGEYDYINSMVAMIPAEDPEFILYATVNEAKPFSILYWQDIVNPMLKKAMSLKDSLNLSEPAPALQSVTGETAYALPDVIGQSPGDTAEELRRHLVQPVILGNGSEIKKTSVKVGSNLAANQQVLLLTSKLTEVPDMYGWTKENMETFAKWTDIKITYNGSGSKVVGQSVGLGTALENTKEITITLGD